MEIIRAELLGMCMGVRRAESAAREAAGQGRRQGRKVFTYGPLIHNPQAVAALEKAGVAVLDPERFDSGALDEIVRGAIVVIRAHGAPPAVFEHLKRLEASIVDATCPLVLKSQKKAREFADRGYSVLIAGERAHDEVAGILGCAPGAEVVETPTEAKTVAQRAQRPGARPIALIAQTTIKQSEYDDIVAQFSACGAPFLAVDTLCPSTSDRQKALADLAERVDAIVVVGGKTSANTRRLFMAARESGKPAWHIESASELPREIFSFNKIGLSAGASTPDSVIEEVEHSLIQGGLYGYAP